MEECGVVVVSLAPAGNPWLQIVGLGRNDSVLVIGIMSPVRKVRVDLLKQLFVEFPFLHLAFNQRHYRHKFG